MSFPKDLKPAANDSSLSSQASKPADIKIATMAGDEPKAGIIKETAALNGLTSPNIDSINKKASKKRAIHKTNKIQQVSFNNFKQSCLLMEERRQKLQHYADREHDNPVARKYAYHIQQSLQEDECDFFHQALMQSLEEIQGSSG